MNATSIWLTLAVVLCILEIFSSTFYMIAIAIGFLAGAAAAAFKLSLSFQIGMSALFALISAFMIRHWKLTHLQNKASDIDNEIGQRVSIEVWQDENHARVRYRGSQWNAVLAHDCQRSDEGHWHISAQHGATLEISNKQPL
ncbi:NfeD family protein [Deefgea salmonis]|uniref:NfeD-like C-terminal domain-containing protein n=1 Tax=Deefgea salmonis TaxID=2875502 RepID=A0ABS8BJQ7_9NEIS|nr:hypothetical protein [Deefgea salmonis]MCB5195958.1 hypothetical protein [Deefgea salmonis]